MLTEKDKEALKNKDFIYFDNLTLDKQKLALNLSIQKKNKKMVEYFIDKGLIFENGFVSSFVIRGAINSDNINYMKWLDNKGIDIYHGSGINLFCAALEGYVEIFNYMYSNIDEKVPEFRKSLVFINVMNNLDNIAKLKNHEKLMKIATKIYPDLTNEEVAEGLSHLKNNEYKAKIFADVLQNSIPLNEHKTISKNKQKI